MVTVLNEKEIIAQRVAKELKDGNIVNLGIGLPTLVSNFIPEGVHIILQAENGILGMGSLCAPGEEDPNVVNAGNQFVTLNTGASFFDSATSFAMIREGTLMLQYLEPFRWTSREILRTILYQGKWFQAWVAVWIWWQVPRK